MTKVKVGFLILSLIILSAWTHGAFLPPSSTPFVFSMPDNSYPTNNGNFTAINNRLVNGSTYKLVCVGDSLSIDGVFGNQYWVPGYCGDTANYLNSQKSIVVTYKSFGMSGYSWAYSYTGPPGNWPPGYTINNESPTQVDLEIVSGLTNILVGFAGTNGIYLGGHSAATEYSDFQTWYNARIAAGWSAANIIVVTMLPRQDSSSFDTTRAAYNTSVKAFCVSNGCKIADAGGDATIGCNGCEDNTACYLSDKIHLSGSGTCGGISGGGMNYLATQLIYSQVP